jgi:hypothetical protein
MFVVPPLGGAFSTFRCDNRHRNRHRNRKKQGRYEPSGSLECGGPAPLFNFCASVFFVKFRVHKFESARGLAHSKALRAKDSLTG